MLEIKNEMVNLVNEQTNEGSEQMPSTLPTNTHEDKETICKNPTRHALDFTVLTGHLCAPSFFCLCELKTLHVL